MNSRYFSQEEFNNNFGKEMVSSQEVYENMKRNGLKDYQFCKFDFDFSSNSKEKLDSLKSFLENNYGYSLKEPELKEGVWILWGDATPFPVDSETILYWALGLYVRGYEYDSKLTGYGALVDNPVFPDLNKEKVDSYFNAGLDAYDKQNTGMAIINWTTVLKIDSNDVNAYYSRAIAKNEIFIWKSALRDYDKAIELAPDFVDAYVNRGATRDESGDYAGALEDYNKAIELKPDIGMIYLNRGNTKYNMGDKNGACADWVKAKELGEDFAEERIKQFCN